MKRQYILETSADGKKWTHRATFREGDESRFGKPFNDEIALREANAFKEYWKPLHQGYDESVFRAINDRKYIRLIIEI